MPIAPLVCSLASHHCRRGPCHWIGQHHDGLCPEIICRPLLDCFWHTNQAIQCRPIVDFQYEQIINCINGAVKLELERWPKMFAKFFELAVFQDCQALVTMQDSPMAAHLISGILGHFLLRHQLQDTLDSVQLPSCHEQVVAVRMSPHERQEHNFLLATFAVNAATTEMDASQYLLHPSNRKNADTFFRNVENTGISFQMPWIEYEIALTAFRDEVERDTAGNRLGCANPMAVANAELAFGAAEFRSLSNRSSRLLIVWFKIRQFLNERKQLVAKKIEERAGFLTTLGLSDNLDLHVAELVLRRRLISVAHQVVESLQHDYAQYFQLAPMSNFEVGYYIRPLPPGVNITTIDINDDVVTFPHVLKPKTSLSPVPGSPELNILATNSTKLNAVLSILDGNKRDGHQTVVFGAHSALHHLQVAIGYTSITHLALLGSAGASAILSQFRTDETDCILIPTSTKFGYGTDLSFASRVIWIGGVDNWAEYRQSIKRVWRVGQVRPVEVKVVVSAETSEDCWVLNDAGEKDKRAQAMMSSHFITDTVDPDIECFTDRVVVDYTTLEREDIMRFWLSPKMTVAYCRNMEALENRAAIDKPSRKRARFE